MKLSEKLKELRAEKGKTQREVAAVLGISENAYKKWEDGRRPGNIVVFHQLAAYYEIPVEFLLEETQKRDEERIKETRDIINDFFEYCCSLKNHIDEFFNELERSTGDETK